MSLSRALCLLVAGFLVGCSSSSSDVMTQPSPSSSAGVDTSYVSDPSTAASTGSVAGTVRDAGSGKPLPGAMVRIRPLGKEESTDQSGAFSFRDVSAGAYTVQVECIGYKRWERTVTIKPDQRLRVQVEMQPEVQSLDEVVVMESVTQTQGRAMGPPAPRSAAFDRALNREDYAHIEDNAFIPTADDPLSTFAIDVDGASYTNVRRFIHDGVRPPVDAVRIEEMLNYFAYDYPAPDAQDEAPFAATMEVGTAPWQPEHRLVHIGLQGERIPAEDRPPSNLVFLLDVSGSMASANKLGLLKRGMALLVDAMRPEDRVAIVVYAGASGLALPSTPGTQKDKILGTLQELSAGGSTAGAAGIQQAYQVAEENFIEDGINRVILATDGDFNVGVSSQGGLVRLIEEKRESGTFLTVLGFGTGNLQDAKMEQLANKGNGAYFYVDTVAEARRVLVDQIGSTLQTIAKDVKVQVEFNPAEVAAYRQIGYVNRQLDDRDFADDTKDAGELGAGHSVTVLYEIVPAGGEVPSTGETPDLKYQRPNGLTDAATASGELLTLKLRYKAPDGDESRLMTAPLQAGADADVSTDFYFAAAVAGFGMLLRESEHRGDVSLDQVRTLAERGRGPDGDGTRAGFIQLVEEARALLNGTATDDTRPDSMRGER